MPTVRFLHDYSGPLTAGRYYPYGDVVTLLDAEQAAGLVTEGAAEMVAPPPVLVHKPTEEDPFQVVVAPAPESAPVEPPPSTGDAPAVKPVKKLGRPKKVKASE